MATYTKLSSASWRVHVRSKGRHVSETFLRRGDARRWATCAERQIDLGETPSKSRAARLKTFGQLIDLHIGDMRDVGKSPLRSKAAALDMPQKHLGKYNIAALDRDRFIRFGRDRAAQGAGTVNIGMDIGFAKLIFSMLPRFRVFPVKSDVVDLWRLIALKRVGLVGTGKGWGIVPFARPLR